MVRLKGAGHNPQAATQTFLLSDGQDMSTTELVGDTQAVGVPVRFLPVPPVSVEEVLRRARAVLTCRQGKFFTKRSQIDRLASEASAR